MPRSTPARVPLRLVPEELEPGAPGLLGLLGVGDLGPAVVEERAVGAGWIVMIASFPSKRREPLRGEPLAGVLDVVDEAHHSWMTTTPGPSLRTRWS